MKKPFIIVLVLAAVLAACFYALSKRNTPEFANHSASSELTLYCAAGLRQPVSQIVDDYTAETGR
jgi:ABC-type molybdate transport system substrate-binding protein